ncbi:MAG: DNA-directed RNA polymerase subunit alpha [Deltaproteobacteria bacterium RIFCSPLOWO2_02_FULL_46_8]|nr:MAG: DNA-directed RNA polymerase subunit alpha [Deltaproteobacteria bacterium RIFCSPLOWO2_02_FULL_46_8]
MYRNWHNLIRPRGLEFDQQELTPTYGKFVASPLERGFGLTLGNALRRVLLSSLQGAAVTSVRFDGVLHEFSTIKGVVEDVSNILLNFKELRFRLHTGEQEVIQINAQGEKELKGSDLELPSHVEILNPDCHIATLGPGAKLKAELTIRLGKGYITAEQNKTPQDSIGVIPMDATFSPIRRVNYNVTNARVGQRTDFDKLTLEVWTDGSVNPEDALAFSAKILKEQLQIFINFDEAVTEVVVEEKPREEGPQLNPNLYRRVEELELSVRSANCLANASIQYIGELVQRSEAEMLKTKNFGRKSLNELKEILAELGLGFGMKIEGFTPLDSEKYRPKEVE